MLSSPTGKSSAPGVRAQTGERFDLAIIGGGAVGCMAALEAARRGLRWVLLERAAIGGATSAHSLGILHGGLRELSRFDLRRHRELARELEWWKRQFPQWVRPLPCLLALDDRGLRRRSAMRIALAAHRVLGRAAGLPALPSGTLDARETYATAPLFEGRQIGGGAQWSEACVNDVPELLAEALRRAAKASPGSQVLEGCNVTGLDRSGNDNLLHIARGAAADGEGASDPARELRSRVVLNAAGPWARSVSAALGDERTELFHPLRAWNLLIDRRPSFDGILGIAPRGGGGLLFARPSGECLLVGTAYAPIEGASDAGGDSSASRAQIDPSATEIEGFLAPLAAAIPSLRLAMTDISEVSSGLVCASAPGAATPAQRSLVIDHAATGGPVGVFSLRSTKLTTSRSLADRALSCAFPHLVPTPWDAWPSDRLD